jgi:tRNA A37 threonylcarbamoyladenosine synthetase subunit TsaC/SUA5/YrdC
MARILTIENAVNFRAALKETCDLLRQGETVALPTETVYGLAANALESKAVEKIYAIKGRPNHNPLIVHVGSVEMARNCASEWPSSAELLAKTTADHVQKRLGGRIALIIDAGGAQVGIESTVVDLSSGVPRILRPGMISAHSIFDVLGCSPGADAATDGGPLKSPGMLLKHYAPQSKLLIWEWAHEEDLLAQIRAKDLAPARCQIIAHDRVPLRETYGGVSVIPHEPEAYARALYAELHRSDETAPEAIILEAIPATPDWDGIRDRLKRAATDQVP